MKFSCTLKKRFAYYKRPFWPVLCLKRIGLPCCTFVIITVTCSLQIISLSNYLLLTISALADITLLKTACHFLLLLVGFNTLTYQKELQLIPYTCGSSDTPLISSVPSFQLHDNDSDGDELVTNQKMMHAYTHSSTLCMEEL